MISNNRKQHIWAVAELIKSEAIKRNMPKEECDELFLLGLLHNVGYEFVDEQNATKHGYKGGEMLKTQGYKYWQEVYYHGVIDSPYQSEKLDLLNWADMHIDGKGQYVTFDGRLKEISERLGRPIETLNAYHIIKQLREKGFE